MGLGRWTTRELREKLQVSAKGVAPRTIRNVIDELVGFLENTPVGSVLGQGEVRELRPHLGERGDDPSPSEEAVWLALDRLFTAEGRGSLQSEEDLPWPWVVFGCLRQEVLDVLSSRAVRENFEVSGGSLSPIVRRR